MNEKSELRFIPLYQKFSLPEEIFDELTICADLNENNKISSSSTNIEKEFAILNVNKKVIDYIENLATNFYNQGFSNKNDQCDLKIKSMWLNKQKKYECNQLHKHVGDISFATWLKIPYDLKIETNLDLRKNPIGLKHSVFEFVYADPSGKIMTEKLSIDKSWEGSIIFFDSNIYHQVYPFYTSDEYRISISGNLKVIERKNIKKLTYN